jgi:hypothetical protein
VRFCSKSLTEVMGAKAPVRQGETLPARRCAVRAAAWQRCARTLPKDPVQCGAGKGEQAMFVDVTPMGQPVAVETVLTKREV